MSAPLEPSTLDELAEAVRSAPRVIPVGSRTHPRLSQVDAVPIGTGRLRGLVEYEPSEYTFTALAGTPVREIKQALGDRGQYLPFDPMLGESGATLGGTVASGLSGPGRFRFGGVRDFILGVRFVDGAGRLLRMGGKVVKNAAGFDLPKFFVGSLGRWGVLAEVTFKVFPKPAASRTLRLDVEGMEGAVRWLREASVNRWELEAVDVVPGGDGVVMRVGGPDAALEPLVEDILGHWPGEVLSATDADVLWGDLAEFRWAHVGGGLLKVPLTLDGMVALDQGLKAAGDVRVHYSGGGNVAYVSMAAGMDRGAFEAVLKAQGLTGLALRGDGPLWWGQRAVTGIEPTLKAALDPESRFPGMED